VAKSIKKHTFSVSKLIFWLAEQKEQKRKRERLQFINIQRMLHWNTMQWLCQSWCVFKLAGNLKIRWDRSQREQDLETCVTLHIVRL